jgi:hypothetical protein
LTPRGVCANIGNTPEMGQQFSPLSNNSFEPIRKTTLGGTVGMVIAVSTFSAVAVEFFFVVTAVTKPDHFAA